MVRKYDVYLRDEIGDKMDRFARLCNEPTARFIAHLCEGLFDNPGYVAPSRGAAVPPERKTDYDKINRANKETDEQRTPDLTTGAAPCCRF